MQEESPEGGRFKKEIVIDNHSYLLLIRDEGGPPELQVMDWNLMKHIFFYVFFYFFNSLHLGWTQ